MSRTPTVGRAGQMSLLVLAAAVSAVGRTGAGARDRTRSQPPFEIWRREIPAWGVPAADQATVYFLTRAHRLLAVDRRDGSIQWSQRLASGRGVPSGSVVLLAGELVIVGDDAILAFDRRNGERRWRFVPVGGVGGLCLSADGSLVLAGSKMGHVYALQASTGALRWSAVVAPESAAVFEPAASGSLVAVRVTVFDVQTRGNIVVLDRETGRERWRAGFAGLTPPAGGPVFTDQALVVASRSGEIVAFDRDTGAERWSIPPVNARVRAGPPQVDVRPLATDGRVLVAGSLSGVVTAYDAGSGHERWRFANAFGGSTRLKISTDGRRVYVPYFSGRLSAISLASGVEEWRVGNAADGFGWPPAASQGQLFLAGYGAFVAYGPIS